MFMTTVAYVNDVSHDDSRTSRLSLLYACASLASMLSYSVSGIILDSTNYETVFALCLVLYVLGILYVICIVREIKPRKEKESDNQNTTDDEANALADIVSLSCRKICRCVKEICMVVFIKRKYNRRAHILVLMIIIVGCCLGACT